MSFGNAAHLPWTAKQMAPRAWPFWHQKGPGLLIAPFPSLAFQSPRPPWSLIQERKSLFLLLRSSFCIGAARHRLPMSASLKKRYLRLVRSAYRLLRSKRLRRFPWLIKLLHPIFDRELWQPSRDTVAHGLAIGLFVSQLPMPGQMLFAALGAMRFSANVPIAVAACWITNPITQLPIWVTQAKFGDFLRETIHIPIHPVLEGISVPLPGSDSLSAGSFILGFLASGFLLLLLAYPAVYLFSALLPKILPKTPYQRAKAKILRQRRAAELTSRLQP